MKTNTKLAIVDFLLAGLNLGLTIMNILGHSEVYVLNAIATVVCLVGGLFILYVDP